MNKPIYLDYAATTPVLPEVVNAMRGCLVAEGNFGNPDSTSHSYGEQASDAIGRAASQVARLLGCKPSELLFTSGATESNNLAIRGCAKAYEKRGKHLVTSSIEHKSVSAVFDFLENEGWEVTRIRPDSEGRTDIDAMLSAVREDTVLVSLMWVNNELGVINDIAALAAGLQNHPAKLHVDAAQAAGKLPIDLAAVPVDYLSISAHKFYGPKGIGALFQRETPRARLQPLMAGGGQQKGLRPGTLPTHQIVGMGKAAVIASDNLASNLQHVSELGGLLERAASSLSWIDSNTNAKKALRSPYILNLRYDQFNGESLHAALRPVLAVSSGSACTSASVEPSRVLREIGLNDAQAEASLRVSLSPSMTQEDILPVFNWLNDVCQLLLRISGRGRGFGSNPASVTRDLSLPNYLRHLFDPQNLSVLSEESVAKGRWVEMKTAYPGSEDFLKIVIRLDGEFVASCHWSAIANPAVIAAASWMSEHIKGQKLDCLEALDIQQLQAELEIHDNKRGDLLFVQDAFAAVIEKAR